MRPIIYRRQLLPPGKRGQRAVRALLDVHRQHRVGQPPAQRARSSRRHVLRPSCSIGSPGPRGHRQPDAAHRLFARLLRPVRIHGERVRRRKKSSVDQHRRPAVAQQQGRDDPDAGHALQSTSPRMTISCAWSYRPRATRRRSASPAAIGRHGRHRGRRLCPRRRDHAVRRAALVQAAQLPDAEAGEAGRGQEQQGHHEAASGR